MEIFYLLCSILSTFFTSLAFSLLLPFRFLLTRHRHPQPPLSTTQVEVVSLYEGTVWHERRRPVRHSFRFLLTIPPSVGYEQNPLSIYYCYDLEGNTKLLKICIAEVTNTPWGERVLFVFDPNSNLVAKPLHVSPFMDLLGNWSLKANAPDQNLLVTISVQHPELGDYFLATLKAKRVSPDSVHDHALFFWLMPHKVALWIYWHALKLWWKNVSFIQHPRYTNPSYREDALNCDRKLRCCPGLRRNRDEHMQVGGSDSVTEVESDHAEQYFVWRDAKWPWS